ncbi:MAG: helix-turn-helix transcriptional regulator [Maricaulis sp.]|nr:helix-turn-helix transcriptional regulator [Maricaulis sp.]
MAAFSAAMTKTVSASASAEMIKILVKARMDAGVTQVQLAKMLNKPQPWVSQVENNVRRIDVIEFYAVAVAIGADPEKLIGDVVKRIKKLVKV